MLIAQQGNLKRSKCVGSIVCVHSDSRVLIYYNFIGKIIAKFKDIIMLIYNRIFIRCVLLNYIKQR